MGLTGWPNKCILSSNGCLPIYIQYFYISYFYIKYFNFVAHINCSGLPGRQNFEPFSQETASGWCDSFSGKMILKRLFVGDTGEASPLHVHCSGLRYTEHQAIFLGVRDLSQYNSFSRMMVLNLKALLYSLVTVGKPLLICSGLG